ncbi:MAG TPA: mechanosensitive ion channel domain-containing protein [Sphingobium sp.]|nr:mechanosensitive ion channel domain-containing protein [Sphingobium sp.]
MLDDMSSWFTDHWFQLAMAMGAGALIYLLLRSLRGVGTKLARREHLPGLLSVVARAATRTSQLFMIIVAARMVSGYADLPAALLSIIGFLFTIIAVFQVAVWLREVIIGLIERRAGTEGSEALVNAMGIIRLLVSVALFAIATVMVLDNLGVNVTGLVAGLGIGGIAIGLAAQGIFSDLFAALSILFDQPFRVGEVITYDQTTARVDRIGLKSTRLRATSGERKIISNTNLLQKEITSLRDLDRRQVKFAFGIIYQTPTDVIARIPDILRDVVEGEKQYFTQAGMVAFSPSSLDFELTLDVLHPATVDYFMIRHRIALGILQRFNAEGIHFAYPTQTSFTAAPDGRMIMPYPAPEDTAAG